MAICFCVSINDDSINTFLCAMRRDFSCLDVSRLLPKFIIYLKADMPTPNRLDFLSKRNRNKKDASFPVCSTVTFPGCENDFT